MILYHLDQVGQRNGPWAGSWAYRIALFGVWGSWRGWEFGDRVSRDELSSQIPLYRAPLEIILAMEAE